MVVRTLLGLGECDAGEPASEEAGSREYPAEGLQNCLTESENDCVPGAGTKVKRSDNRPWPRIPQRCGHERERQEGEQEWIGGSK